MKSWKIPFMANIPIEKEQEFNEKVDIELFYEKQKDMRIEKSYNNPTTHLRKVADYLWLNLNKELSYNQISESLNIPEGTVRGCVSDLNYFNGFPITMIPIPKKTGYIQSVLKNDDHYEKWDRKKMKTITTMSRIKDKAEKITSSKKKTKHKIKQEEVIIVKNRPSGDKNESEMS